MEEDEAKAQRLIFPKKSAEHHPSPQTYRNIHEGMAKLLFGSKHEDWYRGAEQMAISQNSNVFMEDVEKTESENALLNETGNPRKICSHGGKQ